MKTFRADLHVHTVLSPCGDLEMSPQNIIAAALKKKIDIIGITDHNSTRHCGLMQKLGSENGIFVLTGAEVTTKEEVHCLTFFDKTESLTEFQRYLDLHLPFVQNDPYYFGYQVIVDKEENILEQIESLLIVALDQSIDQVRKKVNELNGIFIPAHVNRPSNGILSQLGLMPENLNPDAIEIWGEMSRKSILDKFPLLSSYVLIRSSDAHHPDHIGDSTTQFKLDHISFEEICMALKEKEGREVIIE
jgi:3',5'-nucleoside bisphosphate phosphatase